MTLNFQIKPLNEQEYSEAPVEVRKVYIHVLEKIPMDLAEIKATIKAHPEYFTLKSAEKPKTFGQKVKRLFTLKEDLRKQQSKMINVTGTVKAPRPGEIQLDGIVTSAEAAAQLIKLGESLKEEGMDLNDTINY